MGMEGGRGSGQTKMQMQHAPPGAVYVWANGILSYPKALSTTQADAMMRYMLEGMSNAE